ncbi:thiamine-phosphate kinase [Algiphilus sp. W345]|uniref:Thiamine-monophosphate kinase n=1 Tax=Banduia mediterranea TaxID=3075609 RepID=A0ABU2WNN9_9GAMM|nr:thiamine-phosphate kinase [Algiphilus sp. W345]MDT0498864.1 thiamine-phosphate kinase [Algiphilus sp. W345]
MGEFELIRRHFAELAPDGDGIVLGIGDDAAILDVPPDRQLVVTADTLVAGRHFPERTAAADVGWKSLAVNLSDLAAMGADACWVTLALSLPTLDDAWVAGFSEGFAELARLSGVALVGGDITCGPLTISVTAMGLVPRARALRRSGAKSGDWVVVTGTLGDAAAALARFGQARSVPIGTEAELRRRLERPVPRLDEGRGLLDLASAAIDISDGLLADLGHICTASGTGADLEAARLPASPALSVLVPDPMARLRYQATGGDDYELCLCIPDERLVLAMHVCALTPIGRISQTPGVRLHALDGTLHSFENNGFDHFA